MALLVKDYFDRLLRNTRAPAAETEPPPEAKPSRAAERRAVRESVLLEWIDDEDEHQAETADIVDESDQGLGVRVDRPLPAGSPILITRPNRVATKAVVRHCRQEPGGWFIGVLLVMSDRRRFDRRVFHAPAKMSWQSLDEGAREAEVLLVDASEGGVRVESPAEAPDGAAVSIIHDGWQRFGTIVHVDIADGKHVFGIQFSSPPRPAQICDYHE